MLELMVEVSLSGSLRIELSELNQLQVLFCLDFFLDLDFFEFFLLSFSQTSLLAFVAW